MGNTSSAYAEVDNLVQIGINVAIAGMNSCKGTIDQSQVASITGVNGSTINLGEVDLSQYATIDTSCVQSLSTSASLLNDITQAMKQQATATLDSLGIPSFGTAQSDTILSNVTKLASAVHISVTSTCLSAINQSQAFVINGANGSTITATAVKLSQFASTLSNCVQNSSTVVSAKNDLSQDFTQAASSSVTGLTALVKALTGPLIIFAIAVVAIGGAIFLPKAFHSPGQKKAAKWILVILAVALLIGAVVWGVLKTVKKKELQREVCRRCR